MNTEIRMKIEAILGRDVNPLFDYEIVCKCLSVELGIPRSGWERFYRTVQYHIKSMENEGLLFVHRTTNRGTVFMLKRQAYKYAMGDVLEEIPF